MQGALGFSEPHGPWVIKSFTNPNNLQFVLLFEPYQEVHVRQTTLLKLYGIDMGHSMTQDALICDQIKELLLLELEYTCHQVRKVCRCLTWPQSSQNLRPICIGSHSQKAI